MALRVLVVPDKLKGTLTAREAAAAIAAGWSETRPEDRIQRLPMSDGGDGFAEILGTLLGAERRTCVTTDAAGRACRAEWWWKAEDRVAIIEAAEVNGLARLPAGRFHPFDLETAGLAALLKEAQSAGARQVYVGIGGSATNDGGFGLARRLGWCFRRADGGELSSWTDLEQLSSIAAPTERLIFERLTLAVDVRNPLLGPEGATRIYGGQKGLHESEMPKAEACLGRLAEVWKASTGRDHAAEPGAGAGGGLGFGLRAFCEGTLASGGEIFAALSHLEARLGETDLVVTAEGTFDAQTLMGKGVGLVAAAAARAGKPCLCLVGAVTVSAADVPWPGFRAYAIVPGIAGLEEAMAHAADCLRRLAARVASERTPAL